MPHFSPPFLHLRPGSNSTSFSFILLFPSDGRDRSDVGLSRIGRSVPHVHFRVLASGPGPLIRVMEVPASSAMKVREIAASCRTLRLFLARTPKLILRRRTSCPCLIAKRHSSLDSSMKKLRTHSPLPKLKAATHAISCTFPRKFRSSRGARRCDMHWFDVRHMEKESDRGREARSDKVVEGTKSRKGKFAEIRKIVKTKIQQVQGPDRPPFAFGFGRNSG